MTPTNMREEIKPEVQAFIDLCAKGREWNNQGELGLDEQRIGVWASRINDLISQAEARGREMERLRVWGLFEGVSMHYENNRPSYGQNFRTILERRWSAVEILTFGVDENNYKVAMKLIGVLMNKSPKLGTMDSGLLMKLTEAVEKYESIATLNKREEER